MGKFKEKLSDGIGKDVRIVKNICMIIGEKMNVTKEMLEDKQKRMR